MNNELSSFEIFFVFIILAFTLMFGLIAPFAVMYFVHPIAGIAMYFFLLFWSAKGFYKQERQKQEKRDAAISEAIKLGLSRKQIRDLTRK